ncbi:MFS transporter, partial [Streptomyces spectabilis]
MSTGSGADSAPAPTTLDKPAHPKNSMFSSLRIRNYRLFAAGAVVS